jgi:hypothetical protein
VVDDEQGNVCLARDGGEEAEGGAGALEAGLAAGGGSGKGDRELIARQAEAWYNRVIADA